jgi:aspartate-semialdehyde dehydrogenase
MGKRGVLAVVGATGLIGSEVVSVLGERGAGLYDDVRLFASENSQGEVYKVGEDEVEVELIDADSFAGVDVVVFALRPELVEQYVPMAIDAGASIIDTSGRFATRAGWEYALPGAIGQTKRRGKYVSLPTSPASEIAILVNKIEPLGNIVRVLASTYHSVATAGKYALDELWNQTVSVCNQKEIESEVFAHQIAFNCHPSIDVIDDSGNSREENRICSEVKGVLNKPALPIAVTAVRVPVFHGVGVSLNITFDHPVSVEDFIAVVSQINGFKVDGAEVTMPIDVAGSSNVSISRVRKDPSNPNALNLWMIADGLRRAAENVVDLLIERVTESNEV